MSVFFCDVPLAKKILIPSRFLALSTLFSPPRNNLLSSSLAAVAGRFKLLLLLLLLDMQKKKHKTQIRPKGFYYVCWLCANDEINKNFAFLFTTTVTKRLFFFPFLLLSPLLTSPPPREILCRPNWQRSTETARSQSQTTGW